MPIFMQSDLNNLRIYGWCFPKLVTQPFTRVTFVPQTRHLRLSRPAVRTPRGC